MDITVVTRPYAPETLAEAARCGTITNELLSRLGARLERVLRMRAATWAPTYRLERLIRPASGRAPYPF